MITNKQTKTIVTGFILISAMRSRFITLLFLLMGIVGNDSSSFVSENVVFEKMKEITTTRSKWLVAFVIDIDPYKKLLAQVNQSLSDVKESVTTKFNKESKRHPKPYVRLLRTLSVIKQEISNLEDFRDYLMGELIDMQSIHRQKRSLIPIIGKALSFLFGTLSEDDISAIRGNIRVIAENQKTINHVLKESLTVIEANQAQIFNNSQAINNILAALDELSDFHRLTADFLKLRNHLQIYTELDSAIGEVKGLLDMARDQLQQFRLTLSVLSLGHLAPSVITPSNFRKLLLEIQNKLEPELIFPFDPKVDIWNFYKTLTCTTLLEGGKLVVVIAVPLLDTVGNYELYRVHNFAVPRDIGNGTQLLASFQLEAQALAIDKKRTQFALLSTEEIQTCSSQFQGFCSFRSPVYSIMGNSICLIHLFLESVTEINKYCLTMVQPSHISPRAQYLLNGHWVIVSNTSLTFKVICKGTDTSGIIKTKVPLDTISLGIGCSAFSGQITLLPYYHKESKYNLTNSLEMFLKKFRINTLSLWRTLDVAFPNVSSIKIPKKLTIPTKIPINELINQLNNYNDISPMPKETPFWIYVILILAIIIIIVLAYTFRHKFRHFFAKFKTRKMSVKRGNKEVGQATQELVEQTRDDGASSTTHRLIAVNKLDEISERGDETLTYSPNKRLARDYMAEKYGNSSQTYVPEDLDKWRKELQTFDEYECGTGPNGGFYFAKRNQSGTKSAEAPDNSGNDNAVGTDEKTVQPQQHHETRDVGEKKGQSITFKESAKLYPNLAEMNREGKKTSDKQWKQRETITKTNFK